MKTGERRVCRCTNPRTSAPVHGRSIFAGSFVRREALRRKGACSFSTTARAERYMSLRTPSARPSAAFCPLRQRIFQSLPPLSLEKSFIFSLFCACPLLFPRLTSDRFLPPPCSSVLIFISFRAAGESMRVNNRINSGRTQNRRRSTVSNSVFTEIHIMISLPIAGVICEFHPRSCRNSYLRRIKKSTGRADAFSDSEIADAHCVLPRAAAALRADAQVCHQAAPPASSSKLRFSDEAAPTEHFSVSDFRLP